jgi:hypothetical protein
MDGVWPEHYEVQAIQLAETEGSGREAAGYKAVARKDEGPNFSLTAEQTTREVPSRNPKPRYEVDAGGRVASGGFAKRPPLALGRRRLAAELSYDGPRLRKVWLVGQPIRPGRGEVAQSTGMHIDAEQERQLRPTAGLRIALARKLDSQEGLFVSMERDLTSALDNGEKALCSAYDERNRAEQSSDATGLGVASWRQPAVSCRW